MTSHQGEGTPVDRHGNGRPPSQRAPGDGRGGRLLRARVPLWTLLLIVLLVSAGFMAVVVTQAAGAVDVDPAVGIAQRAEMQLTLCNRDVDRLDLNPRHAELELEKLLKDEGARSAEVRIERRDCPSRR